MQRHRMAVMGLVASVLAWSPPGVAQQVEGGRKPPPEMRMSAAAGLRCQALGWKPDHIENNHITSWEHGMTVPMPVLSIYFSPGGDDAAIYPVAWSWQNTHTGNPVSIELTRDRVNLHIWAGAPLHGYWNARAAGGAGLWTTFSTGYWNVIVCD